MLIGTLIGNQTLEDSADMTDHLGSPTSTRPRYRNEQYTDSNNVLPAEVGSDDPYEARELPDFVPAALRRAIDQRREQWTRIDTLAAGIVGVQLFILFIEVVGGSYYLDDLRAQAYALNQPFWSFIMGSNGTHFAPLPRVIDWVQSRAFPLQHGPAVVLTLVVRLALAVNFWRLLRRIFGPRPLTLVPMVMLAITPAMLPATLWYRQSITIVACTVAMVWALDAHLRWLLHRNRLALAEVAAATVIGVCCYEKAAAIPIILTAATLALFGHVGRRRRGTQTDGQVRSRAVTSILFSSAVVGVFLLIYRSGPYDQGSERGPSVIDVLHLAWDVATRNIIPLLLGGPYSWTFTDTYAGTAHLSTTAIAITIVITGIAAVVAALRRPAPAARALVLLLAWLLPSVSIVAIGRFDALDLVLADATRLWIDLVPAFLLAVALAVLPWEIGACRSTGKGTDTAGPVASAVAGQGPRANLPAASRGGRRASRDRGQPTDRTREREAPTELTLPALAGGLALAIIAVGSAVSTGSYVSRWWDNPTGDYLANMRTSVTQAEAYARVLATPLPEAVMPSWVSSELPTSAPLMRLLRDDLRFHDGDGPVRALNSAGVLTPILQVPIASTAPAPLCVKKIRAGTTTRTGIKFTQPAVYVPGAQVDVGLLLTEATQLKVQVRAKDGRVLTPTAFSTAPVPGQAHVLHYPVPLGETITGVYVTTTATTDVCVTSARVWAPVTG